MRAEPARLVAIFLLLIWVGPVTFVQTDGPRLMTWVGAPGRVSADTRVIPAGRAIQLAPGSEIKLRLRDGSVLEGRYLGRTLLDSAVYVPRYSASAETSSYVPIALGETLHVALQGGREWVAPFAGYSELTLLLRNPDGPQYLRASFEYVREIRRANGDQVKPDELARAFRRGLLPSAEALAIESAPVGTLAERWASALRVPVEDITFATVVLKDKSGTSAGAVVGIVVLSVVASVVIVFAILSASLSSASKGCRSYPIDSRALSGIPLTTRPFDRYTGRFVGDSLVAADEPNRHSALGVDSLEVMDVPSPERATLHP